MHMYGSLYTESPFLNDLMVLITQFKWFSVQPEVHLVKLCPDSE